MKCLIVILNRLIIVKVHVVECLDDDSHWMQDNYLQLNPEKTEILVISTRPGLQMCNIDYMSVAHSQVSPAPSVKDLKITVTPYCTECPMYWLPSYSVCKMWLHALSVGSKKYSHITPVQRELHWLPVRFRVEYKIGLIVFKCLNALAPSYLTDLLHPYVPTRSLRSASKGLLQVPRSRLSTFGARSFASFAPRLWNDCLLH